jgi:hypothetical protein
MTRHRRQRVNEHQLDLFAPPADGWWEAPYGAGMVRVRAETPEQAREKAEAQLRELGILPGGPPGLHESFRRMADFAAGRSSGTLPIDPSRL